MDQRGPHCPSLGPRERPEPVHSPAPPYTERRPRGASPQPGVVPRALMRRVGGRGRTRSSGGGGPEGETPPMSARGTNPRKGEQRQVGGSAGAALPRKDNTGAQRSAQAVQNAAVECKGKSRPDGTLQSTGSRRESGA